MKNKEFVIKILGLIDESKSTSYSDYIYDMLWSIRDINLKDVLYIALNDTFPDEHQKYIDKIISSAIYNNRVLNIVPELYSYITEYEDLDSTKYLLKYLLLNYRNSRCENDNINLFNVVNKFSKIIEKHIDYIFLNVDMFSAVSNLSESFRGLPTYITTRLEDMGDIPHEMKILYGIENYSFKVIYLALMYDKFDFLSKQQLYIELQKAINNQYGKSNTMLSGLIFLYNENKHALYLKELIKIIFNIVQSDRKLYNIVYLTNLVVIRLHPLVNGNPVIEVAEMMLEEGVIDKEEFKRYKKAALKLDVM